jgi:DNA (cytosine-5)-methyltransferase 1
LGEYSTHKQGELKMSLSSIELFAGAGGLAMGVSLAGFQSRSVVEWDKWACDTVLQNQRLGHPLVRDWPVVAGDVRHWIDGVDTTFMSDRLDLVAGGPPCQPFSMGGKHQANQDSRDMFPVTVEVIRRLKPRAFIVENVKGLTRSTFHNYYQYILLQLEFPEIARHPDESWNDHHHRLQQFKTAKRRHHVGLTYNVLPTLVNAANYGVPQKRERVFIVGFRSDLPVRWSFPRETHSLDALLHTQWVTGEYWDLHKVAKRSRPTMPGTLGATVARIKGLGLLPTRAPWRTVRDALAGLTDPEKGEGDALNHRFQGGARSYIGHTGSPLDLPAKTLKAGDHGVPGGENMLVREDGSVRYFTVRESARLQTFPDGYAFHGSWTEAMRQLGNAVPVALGRVVASSVAEHLLNEDSRQISLGNTMPQLELVAA